MSPVRWLLSRIPSAQYPAMLRTAARFIAGLLVSLRPQTVLFVVALGMIGWAAWRIHPEGALLLVGFLILRDLERPEDPPAKS
jgi:uncharacterized membrane protein YecN with MAPEG domain